MAKCLLARQNYKILVKKKKRGSLDHGYLERIDIILTSNRIRTMQGK